MSLVGEHGCVLCLNLLGRLHCSPVRRLRFCPVRNPNGGTHLCERPYGSVEQSRRNRQQQEHLGSSSAGGTCRTVCLHLVSVSNWSLWCCGEAGIDREGTYPWSKAGAGALTVPLLLWLGTADPRREAPRRSLSPEHQESFRPWWGVQGLFLREALPASLPPQDTQEWFGFSVGRWLWEREECAAGRQQAGPGTSGEGPLGSAALLPPKNTQPGLCCGSSN